MPEKSFYPAENRGESSPYDFFAGNGKTLLWVTLLLAVLVILVVFHDFLLTDTYYLFKGIGSDSYDALYPYLYNAAGTFPRHGWPTWSFNYGMGENTFPLFLRDPFDLILYLAGRPNIAAGIIYVEIIKILLTCFVFYRYLKLLGLNDLVVAAGSIAYSFCSYMIIGGVWHFFSFEVLNMAVLLLTTETLIIKGRSRLLPLPFFLIGLTMPLNFYLFGLFLACYLVLRLAQLDRLYATNVLKLSGQITLYGVAGALLSGPFLLENAALLLESPRGSGISSISHLLHQMPVYGHSPARQMGTFILRFFSDDLLGGPQGFRGWRNTFEAPMFWCSLPVLLLAPQVFVATTRKKKLVYAVLLLIWLLPVFFPWFRFAFWLFTGNYFRVYSFFVSLLLLLLALKALDNVLSRSQLNLPLLGGTLAALLVLLLLPYFGKNNLVDHMLQGLVAMLLCIYAGLIFLISKPGHAPWLKWLLLGVVVAEVSGFNLVTVSGWAPISQTETTTGKAYTDRTLVAVAFLHQKDQGFYRVDKNYSSSISGFPSFNDGMMQDYFGTSSYGSFNQMHYVRYLQTCGLADPRRESESRWAKGLAGAPVFESQSAVKYFFVKGYVPAAWYLIADSIANFKDVKVYRNRYALPMGFTCNRYTPLSTFATLSRYAKSCIAAKAFVVEDHDVAQLSALQKTNPTDTPTLQGTDTAAIPVVYNLLRQYYDSLRQDTLLFTHQTETSFIGTIQAHRTELLYLSIPYDAGWHISIDGNPAQKLILNGGMTGVLLQPGPHKINIIYKRRFVLAGITMSVFGLLLLVGLFLYERSMKIK